MDTDTDIDTDTDMDMDTDRDMDMDMELGTFTKYLIQRNSPYSAVRNDFNISRRNFQRQYVLSAPFYDEEMTRRFWKIHTAIEIETALHMLAELARSVLWLKKSRYQRFVR